MVLLISRQWQCPTWHWDYILALVERCKAAVHVEVSDVALRSRHPGVDGAMRVPKLLFEDAGGLRQSDAARWLSLALLAAS